MKIRAEEEGEAEGEVKIRTIAGRLPDLSTHFTNVGGSVFPEKQEKKRLVRDGKAEKSVRKFQLSTAEEERESTSKDKRKERIATGQRSQKKVLFGKANPSVLSTKGRVYLTEWRGGKEGSECL